MTDRTFDWKPKFDERSRSFSVSALVGATVPRVPKSWSAGPLLNQQAEGACVGHGWVGHVTASPRRRVLPDPQQSAFDIYHRALQIDEWPGEADEGTSVLAGAKAVMEQDWIKSYRWAFSTSEVIDALITLGPVVIGIPWYDTMLQTRPSGLVEIGGNLIGGHCLLLTGYHPRARIVGEDWTTRFDVVKWRNSWGLEYGKLGSGYVLVEDLDTLLRDEAEMCVPSKRL